MSHASGKHPRFLLDLAEEMLWLIEHAGAEVAERWYDALMVTIEFIEQNPLIGRVRKDLSPASIRTWRVRGFARWLVFYRVTGDQTVVFYRVRSGTMNLVVMNLES